MTQINPKLIQEAGLNVERIQSHAERVRAAVSGGVSTNIPIVGACTVENGHVVGWHHLEEWVSGAASGMGEACFADLHRHWQERHLVTVIPAAGAASRFLGEFQKFVLDVELRIPGLKELVTAARTGSVPPISECERKAMETAFESLTIPEKFSSLPQTILEQEDHEIRHEWMRQVSALLDIIETGTLSDEYKRAFAATGPEDVPVPKPFSLADMRSPWRSFVSHEGGDCDEESCSCGETCEESMGEFQFQPVHHYAAARAFLDLYSGIPKALVPTTSEGDTFLRLKMVEQVSLLPSAGNVLIVPAGQVSHVEKIVKQEGEYLTSSYRNPFALSRTPFAPTWLDENPEATGRWIIMEQGTDLSTIRFHADGRPFEESGKYSIVAAGHGELVHLFQSIAEEFPRAEGIHIKNIDNVIGATLEKQTEMSTLSDGFRLVRDAIEYLRHICETSQADETVTDLDAAIALEFLAGLLPLGAVDIALEKCLDSEGEFLGITPATVFEVLGRLFHWSPEPSSHISSWKHVGELLSRPLSLFGVVRKEDGDVGGGPVLVKPAGGEEIKICLEMPHAGPEDSKSYFGPGGKATHFNPVLAFFELRTHTKPFAEKAEPGRICDFRRLFDDRFWMLSRKEYQGKPVCYHETVLYELIGNSATTNLVFVEAPRSLFHPHKTMFDSLGRTRESYGFHEALRESEEHGEGA